MAGKGIDSFCAHAIQSDRKLKHIIIIFGAGIDLADAFDHFPKRNAPSKIAAQKLCRLSSSSSIDDFFAMLHDEFIDAIVDDFFQHDINAIVGMGSISQTTDVHARTQPDMAQCI